MGTKIRVLLADDSAFMRKVLESILSADPQLEVVGTARDGREAVTEAERLKPDVITMDLNMPHMNGLEATEVIMSSHPCPIVVVSSESREGAEPTLHALELGAIDFVAKPTSGIDLDMGSVREELLRKIKMASKVRVVRNVIRRQGSIPSGTLSAVPVEPKAVEPVEPVSVQPLTSRPASLPSQNGAKHPLVVIAASTGGPATLMELMPQFPANFAGSVLIVQHMPGAFTGQFSQQLNDVCAMRVKEAESGETFQPGVVYVAPGAFHLRVTPAGRFVLDDGPRINGYKPCADVTLETVSSYGGTSVIAVVLTGMGNDASQGALAVKERGGYVIAQDEASAIIFGMPGEAIRVGAVDQVVPTQGVYSTVEKRLMYLMGVARVGAL